MSLSVNAKKGLVFGIAVLLILIGFVVGGLWSLIFTAIYEGEMALTSTSTTFGMWEETPIPMYVEIYLFNCTNAEKFQEDPQNIKPEYSEMGPYVFSEHHTKVDLSWNDNGTVTFRQIRKWHFIPERSNGTLRDEITNFNIIAVTVEYMIRNMNPMVQLIVDRLVENVETLFVTKTVGQLLYEGYEDDLLNLTATLNVSDFQVPFDKFGWFYPRNNSRTYDGVFNMHTGTDDINLLGIMAKWNYEEYPTYYDGECAKITGSTGELFPPMENADDVSLFAPEICSSLKLVKSDETYERYGLSAYKFIGDDSAFDNGTKYPEKRCFCAKNQLVGRNANIRSCTEECMPSGVRGISQCRFGAPAFISYPHFYLADHWYLENINGLNPKKELHEFYLAVEPVTGIPLDVKARMQINFMLRPYEDSDLFQNMPIAMIPALWFTQSAELTSDLADVTKLLVRLPAIGHGTFFGIGGIGVLLLFAGIMITLRNGWEGEDVDKLLSSSPSVREVNESSEMIRD